MREESLDEKLENMENSMKENGMKIGKIDEGEIMSTEEMFKGLEGADSEEEFAEFGEGTENSGNENGLDTGEISYASHLEVDPEIACDNCGERYHQSEFKGQRYWGRDYLPDGTETEIYVGECPNCGYLTELPNGVYIRQRTDTPKVEQSELWDELGGKEFTHHAVGSEDIFKDMPKGFEMEQKKEGKGFWKKNKKGAR
jgi:hypothetical protein